MKHDRKRQKCECQSGIFFLFFLFLFAMVGADRRVCFFLSWCDVVCESTFFCWTYCGSVAREDGPIFLVSSNSGNFAPQIVPKTFPVDGISLTPVSFDPRNATTTAAEKGSGCSKEGRSNIGEVASRCSNARLFCSPLYFSGLET